MDRFETSKRKALAAFRRRFGGENCGREVKIVNRRGRAYAVVRDLVTRRASEFDVSNVRLRYVGEVSFIGTK